MYRMLALMKDSMTSFNKEEFIKSLLVPATHAHHSKHLLEKSITLGLVEGSVQVYLNNCTSDLLLLICIA